MLFWDIDPATLDPKLHEDFILGRVLSEGTEEMVCALRAAVGDSGLRSFLERAPHRLDQRTRRFLEVVLEAPATHQPQCTTTPFRRSSDALFSR
jgi:hypothetical protein